MKAPPYCCDSCCYRHGHPPMNDCDPSYNPCQRAPADQWCDKYEPDCELAPEEHAKVVARGDRNEEPYPPDSWRII